MNQKELNEIRRHLSLKRCGIHKIYGCFVSSGKEIISDFQTSFGLMSEFEAEKYLSLLKKTLSGTLGKNLLDLSFSTQQVVDSPEHKRLSALRNTQLEEPSARAAFFQSVIASLSLGDTPYLILLAHDVYDVPHRGGDDELQADASDQVFSYLLCAICPVKEEKPELAYAPGDKVFRTRGISQIISPPELGFLFPTFDQRAANLYHAQFIQTRGRNYQDFIDEIFTGLPVRAHSGKLQHALTVSLNETCSYDVIQGVHEQFRERIAQHKESRDPEPLDLSIREVGAILQESGVPKAHIEAFEETCIQQFGENAALSPSNLIDSKRFQVASPQLKISIDPESSSFIEARILHGRKYLLVPVTDEVEVNGIPIHFPEEEPC
ncbi:MAG: DUF4317 domain-containing protein [Evtepia gabavorous]